MTYLVRHLMTVVIGYKLADNSILKSHKDTANSDILQFIYMHFIL